MKYATDATDATARKEGREGARCPLDAAWPMATSTATIDDGLPGRPRERPRCLQWHRRHHQGHRRPPAVAHRRRSRPRREKSCQAPMISPIARPSRPRLWKKPSAAHRAAGRARSPENARRAPARPAPRRGPCPSTAAETNERDEGKPMTRWSASRRPRPKSPTSSA